MAEDITPAPDAAVLEFLTQMKTQAEALVSEIKSHVESAATRNQEIEQGRVYAERTKTELEEGITAERAQWEEISKRLEGANAMNAKLLELQAAAQTETNAVLENHAQTVAILETLVRLAHPRA